MNHRALTTAGVIVPMMLCQCHTATPAEKLADDIDDPTPAVFQAPKLMVDSCMDMLSQEYSHMPMTAEETEDLHEVLRPLCDTQEAINVYYHGIEYKGDKPVVYLLGTLHADDFKQLATSTHAVAYGEVIDDFERYTFGSLNGKKVEAYISLSNREYGIELTGAPAVYAPQFHDRVLAMRKMLVLPAADSTAENTQH